MNIYIYLKMFPPFYQGDKINNGAVKYVHGLASGLVECGATVTVLCEGSRSDTWNDSFFQTPSGYEIKYFANPHKHLSFKIATNLQKYISQEMQPGIVILNAIFHPSVYSMSRLLKKKNFPYIISPLDPYHPSIFSKNSHLKWPYWYLFERPMLEQAKAIQLLDIRHTEWLRRLQINTPAIETPCGFATDNIYPESLLQWRGEGTTKLFFLGRMDAHNKGLDMLLDAFADISQITNTTLTFQGPDNGDRKTLENKANQLSKSDQIFFLDPDFNSSASAIIAKYDIFCVPSRFEGFSLAALEAMLAGRVLLVSEIAGIAPYVQNSGCGVVVKPTIPEIKAGLIKLLQLRPQWKEMGLRGRNYVLNDLQWKKIAANALDHYQKIITNKPSAILEPFKIA